jgi:cytochrome c553
MSAEPLVSFRNRWFAGAVAVMAGLALVGAIVGFLWLPHAQPGEQFSGMWDAICSAAGLVRTRPGTEAVVQPGYQTTRVELFPGMLAGASAESIGRGATLALRCTMCHGARGLSEANSPNLAGQFPAVIYKQLADFKAGARQSAVMGPLVANLSDADMRDLAAYYAYLPRLSGGSADGAPPLIVASGAPLRGIAPCGTCHGEIERKIGAAWLEGQPATYLRAQLEDFASGARHNDIDEQMRNVARRMTAEEIGAASQYYAEHP